MIFACTHLDLKAPNRLTQAGLIVKHFGNNSYPMNLGGDFNDKADGPAIAFLDQHFTRSCKQNCLPTIPVENPNRTIDFVMFKPQSAVTNTSTRVIDERFAWDHLPVVVELRVF